MISHILPGGRRKAQIEMIGLVMIVVIVVTGLLLFMVQKMSQPVKSIQKAYINEKTANDMITNLEDINVIDCNGLPLSTLIVDCAKSQPSLYCDNDYSSCHVANKTIFDILNRTLIEWDVAFTFSISSNLHNPKQFINFTNFRCGSREVISAFEYLSLYSEASEKSENVEIKLKICPD